MKAGNKVQAPGRIWGLNTRWRSCQNLMCAPPASTSVRSEPTATSIRLANLMPYLLPLLSTAAGIASQRSISPLCFTAPHLGEGRQTIGGHPTDRQAG